MFLTKRKRAQVLRVGRDAIERWEQTAQGWELRMMASLTVEGERVAALAPAMETALQTAATEESVQSVVVVLESTWLPVTLVPLGPDLWSRKHAELLLRHRFREVHGLDGQSDVSMDFRAGEPQALGYALAHPVKEVLLSSARVAGVELASLQPAFAWGREALCRRGGRHADGYGPDGAAWWVWSEQDRALVALLRRGRVMSLNPGAPQVSNLEAAKCCVALECVRQGGRMKDAPVLAAGWPGQPLDEVGAL